MGFWENKKVMITGHTGFKGSWLDIWLNSLGAQVCGISLEKQSKSCLINLEATNSRTTHYIGDIRDEALVLEILNKHKPDIVFHMAAQPLVMEGYKDPIETYSTNVLGTASVMNALRKFNDTEDQVAVFINITTDKVYENKEWVWGYRETDRLGGKDPYSASKACSELVTASFANSYFKESTIIATARAGNVIGGGDWSADRLIPDCVKALSQRTSPIIRRPKSVRPWQHVTEPLAGYMILAQYLYEKKIREQFSSWNFGSDKSDTVEYITRTMIRLWGDDKQKLNIVDSSYEETTLLKLNSAKATTYLNWKNVLDIDQILAYVTEWYKDYCIEKKNPYQITQKQLVELSKLFSNTDLHIR